jgi:hypothetical protein
MASITTITVGLNAQPLAPAPVVGAAADVVTVINLDTANTVNLGSQANQLALQLGPLASVTLTAPVWAGAATVPLEIGIIPGGGSYSPGSLTITGPVTAEITGPVTVEGTVAIGGTPNVNVANTPGVTISGTPTVDIGTVSGSIAIASVSGNVDVVGAGGFITGGQVGNLIGSVARTVGAGGQTFIGTLVSVQNYSSIVLTIGPITNSSVAAGAAVCGVFGIAWFDSTGYEMAQDTVSIACGTSVVSWEIPARGSSFSLFVLNAGSTGTITIASGNINVDGSYRVVPNIRVLSSGITTQPTLTGCTVLAQGTPVYEIGQWVSAINYTWAGAITNTVFLLAEWSGQVSGYYQIITTGLVRNANIVDLSYALQGGVVSGSGYTNGIIQSYPGATDPAPVVVSFNLPPTQCAIILDTPAAAGGFALSLIGVGNLLRHCTGSIISSTEMSRSTRPASHDPGRRSRCSHPPCALAASATTRASHPEKSPSRRPATIRVEIAVRV